VFTAYFRTWHRTNGTRHIRHMICMMYAKYCHRCKVMWTTVRTIITTFVKNGLPLPRGKGRLLWIHILCSLNNQCEGNRHTGDNFHERANTLPRRAPTTWPPEIQSQAVWHRAVTVHRRLRTRGTIATESNYSHYGKSHATKDDANQRWLYM